MIPFSDPDVERAFDKFPPGVRPEMCALRDLIFETAQRVGVQLEESLKWGEPAYACKGGSTVRIDWKEADPEFYRIYFHCQTSLIPTFRKLYGKHFHFEGNRAIRFAVNSGPDLCLLGNCVEVALKYHSVKSLPHLGLNRSCSEDPEV